MEMAKQTFFGATAPLGPIASGRALTTTVGSDSWQQVMTLADLNWSAVDGLETGDLLVGGSTTNTLHGTVSGDLMFGGAGADTVTGGLGSDQFRFIGASEGVDTITDFVAGLDKMQVLSSGFASLEVGAVQAANFVLGTSPTQATPQFLYNTTTGLLAFDADGTGGSVSVDLVALIGSPTLAAADIVVVGG